MHTYINIKIVIFYFIFMEDLNIFHKCNYIMISIYEVMGYIFKFLSKYKY